MNFGISEKSETQIVDLLKSYPEVDEAKVFGSRAMGNYKHGSDIDIALFGTSLTINIIMDISAALNERSSLPYHFDIIGYSSLDDLELKKHINEFGEVLFKKK